MGRKEKENGTFEPVVIGAIPDLAIVLIY